MPVASATTVDMRGRRGRPWRRLCAEVYRTETHCWICGGWVDQALPWRHDWSRSVDHVIPLAHGGPPLARWNVRLAHRRCNVLRGDGTRPPATPSAGPLGAPSREW